MIAQQFMEQGHSIKAVLDNCSLSRSSYYYRPKQRSDKKGVPKSEYTITQNGEYVCNNQVVKQIEELLSKEFVDYGYIKVTHWLRQEYGYIINPKKVYRLMRENGLLNNKKKFPKPSRKHWVKQLVPKPLSVFDYLEFDIKYMYVPGCGRNALMITVLDVYSRWVLGHRIQWSIKEKDVKALFDQILSQYPLPSRFYVRCDNGSQFIASSVQKYFERKNIVQEFTKPATPEQNAHIEAYHSIIENVICRRYEFENIEELRQTLIRFVEFYNMDRIHSGIDYLSPYKYLLQKGIDLKSQSLREALCSKTNIKPNFEKSVQFIGG